MGDIRYDLLRLAEEFDRRAGVSVAALSRVTKPMILRKCADDLRALLASHPAPSPAAEDHPPAVLADAARLLRKSDPEIAAGLDALIRSWPRDPAPSDELRDAAERVYRAYRGDKDGKHFMWARGARHAALDRLGAILGLRKGN